MNGSQNVIQLVKQLICTHEELKATVCKWTDEEYSSASVRLAECLDWSSAYTRSPKKQLLMPEKYNDLAI